jgi:hypothetical protein
VVKCMSQREKGLHCSSLCEAIPDIDKHDLKLLNCIYTIIAKRVIIFKVCLC